MGKATCSARLVADGVTPAPTQQVFTAPPPGSVTAPQLITPMKDVTGTEGDSATFQCVITGNPGMEGEGARPGCSVHAAFFSMAHTLIAFYTNKTLYALKSCIIIFTLSLAVLYLSLNIYSLQK